MSDKLAAFLNDESGATAIEYALIASGISMSIVVAAGAIGTNLSQIFADVAAGF